MLFLSANDAPRSAVRRHGLQSVSMAGLQVYLSKLTRTCYATPAASPWPTRARIRGLFRTTLDTGIFSIPSCTPRPTRRGLGGCGDNYYRQDEIPWNC